MQNTLQPAVADVTEDQAKKLASRLAKQAEAGEVESQQFKDDLVKHCRYQEFWRGKGKKLREGKHSRVLAPLIAALPEGQRALAVQGKADATSAQPQSSTATGAPTTMLAATTAVAPSAKASASSNASSGFQVKRRRFSTKTAPSLRRRIAASSTNIASATAIPAHSSSSRTRPIQTINPYPPAIGETILVLEKRFFEMMLSGAKTLEIRPMCYKPRTWHVGHGGLIFGTITLGPGEIIATNKIWHALRHRHHHDKADLPHKRTCALPVTDPKMFCATIPYVHHQGSIGTCRYEPVESGLGAMKRPAAKLLEVFAGEASKATKMQKHSADNDDGGFYQEMSDLFDSHESGTAPVARAPTAGSNQRMGTAEADEARLADLIMEYDFHGAAALKSKMDDRMQELQNQLAGLDTDDEAVASLRAELEEYHTAMARLTSRKLETKLKRMHRN